MEEILGEEPEEVRRTNARTTNVTVELPPVFRTPPMSSLKNSLANSLVDP